MPNPLEKLKAFIEKGARNNANDATMIQTMHDHSVSLGASCGVSEAADFSTSDVMVLLDAAVRKTFKNEYNYPRVCDLYDDYLVFSSDYSSATCYKCDYSVNESGAVTLGQPVAVVRKVTYIEPNTATIESDEIEIDSDGVSLIEADENDVDLTEAKTRVVKLIAPGWGSSGFYPVDVLKRDGPNVFKAGLHNFIDHPTAIEDRDRPEGSLSKLASVLTEDATWKDDYKGNGPGLYSKVKANDMFGQFLDGFSDNIGMSIRASGKVKIGEADGKKGPIVESITTAKSVDYVTLPGAGGKVLELFESAKHNGSIVDVKIKEKDVTPMATDEEFNSLKESVNKLVTQNARLIEREIMRDARDYATRRLTDPNVKLHAATKARILDSLVVTAPLSEAGTVDYKAFDALIETAVNNEIGYLTNVGALGKISGFGASQSIEVKPFDADKAFGELQESLKLLD